jgi:hypothetical protein
MSATVISLLAARRARAPSVRPGPPPDARTVVFVPAGFWRAPRSPARVLPGPAFAAAHEVLRLARARLLVGALPHGPYRVRATPAGEFERCAVCGGPVARSDAAVRAEAAKASAGGVREFGAHPGCVRALEAAAEPG